MSSLPYTIDVNICEKSKSYPIVINRDELSSLKEQIFKHIRGKKYLVVVSQKVESIYGKILGFGKENKFVLKDGEEEKNFSNYKKILDKALNLGLTRKDTIIAIGGGVVGDLAGFAAATYMRGIDLIQVPTTLLACVDSSVGGKVGINTDYGKNLVGDFHQPKAVLINTNFLTTLDEKQFKTGLGEVVKYGLIEKSCHYDEDQNLVNFLNENIEKINAKDTKILAKLVRICVNLKVSVVQKDEQEGGLRQILNFGHTLGHAIEKETKYKKFTHGESIVEGMKYAFDLAFKKGLIDKNYKFFADDFIKKFEFKEIPKFPMHKLVQHMKMDKKASAEAIVFVLPVDYLKVEIFDVKPDELMDD